MISNTPTRYARRALCWLALAGLWAVTFADARPFTHRTNESNLRDYYTIINHTSANGLPDRLLFVTPRYVENANAASTVGVWYDPDIERWTIYNESKEPLSVGASFSVVALRDTLPNAFTHTATADNTEEYWTYISHPAADFNPDAMLLITPHWSEAYVPGPIGVWYDGESWSIFRQDREPLPVGSRFNVFVVDNENADLSLGRYPDLRKVIKHTTDRQNLRGYLTDTKHDGRSDVVLVTHNWGEAGPYNTGLVGVWYDGASWKIINLDRERMQRDSKFNVFCFEIGTSFTALLSGAPTETEPLPEPFPTGPPKSPEPTPAGFIAFANESNYEVRFTITYSRSGQFYFEQLGVTAPGESERLDLPAGSSSISVKAVATQGNGEKTVFEEIFTLPPNQTLTVTGTFDEPAWQ